MTDYRDSVWGQNSVSDMSGSIGGQKSSNGKKGGDDGMKIVIDTSKVTNQVIGTAIGFGTTMAIQWLIRSYGDN